jgi:hypothetical protein
MKKVPKKIRKKITIRKRTGERGRHGEAGGGLRKLTVEGQGVRDKKKL